MASENQFDRLPPELMVSIFDKIMDLKCLCICYSVSKLFASLVLQTHFISVPHRRSRFLPCDYSPGILNFLKKFCCTESVIIQFSPRNGLPRYLPLVRWKSDSRNFIFVSARSRIDDISGNPMVEAAWESELDFYNILFVSIIKHMSHLRHRFLYTKELLALFPNLKNIVAVESTEQGSIVWEEEIARRKQPENLLGDFCVKLWTAPLVRLPCSGCAMKDVILISIEEEKNCSLLFEEEEEYRELATTIIKEYPCKQTSGIYIDQPDISWDRPDFTWDIQYVFDLIYDLHRSTN